VISGVVGAASSVTSIQVANLLRLFRIPQVSSSHKFPPKWTRNLIVRKERKGRKAEGNSLPFVVEFLIFYCLPFTQFKLVFAVNLPLLDSKCSQSTSCGICALNNNGLEGGVN
jgi:hypothetical protein